MQQLPALLVPRPPCLRHSAGRLCLTAGEAEMLTVLRQVGFVANAFAEILHEIQPRFGIAFQTLKDRSTLVRYPAGLVFAQQTLIILFF